MQLERFFERQTDGEFKPYVPQSQSVSQSRQRVVYTKLKLYTVNMLFDADQKVLVLELAIFLLIILLLLQSKSGLLLSWIPDVLARSQFGQMQVEFTLQTRAPP